MIASLLVANRGEVAVRVMATAGALGIRTVAVYTPDDAECAHVRRADEAVELPTPGPAGYLDIAPVVAAAVGNGCDAVHPGYGFLSENPAFARACVAAGVAFVGPAPESLELLGDKTATRQRAAELDIPIPAGTGGATDPETARAFLDSLGPDGAVMVKAVSGGGGRGMREVHDPAELPAAYASAAAEAGASSGDDSLYVERLLAHARHIEVQIAGDGTGAVVALGDRDCSVQRRHQKLIEIAPAPNVADATRQRLHDGAVRLGASARLSGLATVEFLVQHDEIAFLEVNPRLQVEHTVTEEVLDSDLVELGLRIADGARLADLGIAAAPESRGVAVQARVNAETLRPDGTVQPGDGALSRFQPPSGRGIRVDTHGYLGYSVNPRYDSLLAKVIVSGRDLPAAAARARRALTEFDIAGVPTTLPALRTLLAEPAVACGAIDTGFVTAHHEAILAAQDVTDPRPESGYTPAAPPDAVTVAATLSGTVVAVSVAEGDVLAPGEQLAVLEAMKMEHPVAAEHGGTVAALLVKTGDSVTAGTPIAFLSDADAASGTSRGSEPVDPDRIRPDLAEVLDRHQTGLDEHRPEAVERRHGAGRLTARESIARLVDADSFVEYGALAIAAQRRRRTQADLVARTPADGLVMGTATVAGRPIAVMAYDYTVLAGTQGIHNHRKTDRLFRLVGRQGLPLVILAEGGGGRPGDSDTSAVAGLDVPTFRLAAELAGQVPMIAMVSGYCFAGNAALVGCCDVVIATEGSSLGMGGPAMIEGGGLGAVAAADVGPMDMQYTNGVVDVLAPNDSAAVDTVGRYLRYLDGSGEPCAAADQRELRHLIPENRARAYPVRPVIETLFDQDSVLELRAGFGAGIVTALARLNGRAVGVLANDCQQLGGAIDGDAADKATRFFGLCSKNGLPVVSLCDTPGFMVGTAAERTATVRRFGDLFRVAAARATPLVTVVLRKAYGLGAQAMAGGSLHTPELTVAWPTGEFGGMGLEGAVRLGFRKELDAIADPSERHARYQQLVAEYYEQGKALSAATVFEIDDVIDPAETRAILDQALAATRTGP